MFLCKYWLFQGCVGLIIKPVLGDVRWRATVSWQADTAVLIGASDHPEDWRDPLTLRYMPSRPRNNPVQGSNINVFFNLMIFVHSNICKVDRRVR